MDKSFYQDIISIHQNMNTGAQTLICIVKVSVIQWVRIDFLKSNLFPMPLIIAKVKSLYIVLNSKFTQFSVAQENLSIDESVVSYYGCHLCKQLFVLSLYVWNINYGYLRAPLGFFNFEIYEGRTANWGTTCQT